MEIKSASVSRRCCVKRGSRTANPVECSWATCASTNACCSDGESLETGVEADTSGDADEQQREIGREEQEEEEEEEEEGGEDEHLQAEEEHGGGQEDEAGGEERA